MPNGRKQSHALSIGWSKLILNAGVDGRLPPPKRMRPTSYPLRRDILKQFWYAFMKTGCVEAVAGYDPDPDIVRSWQRCAPRSNPQQPPRFVSLQASALNTTLKTYTDLLEQARPFLEDIHRFYEGAYCTIVFTDSAGCILEIKGDSRIVAQSHVPTTTRGRWADRQGSVNGESASGVHPGAMWAETYLGTNGIGLALVTGNPAQVVGAEHYYEVFHEMATSAAPVHDVNGRIIGTISVIEPVTSTTRHSLSLVMAAGRALSNLLHANLYLQEANYRLAQVNTILGTIREGVVAWNANGKITHLNYRAGKLLRLNPRQATGQPLAKLLPLPPALIQAIDEAREISDLEVTFDLPQGEPVQAMVSLRILPKAQASPSGYLLMIRPIAQVRRLVNQQVGTRAALVLDDIAARSSGMRIVIRQAHTAARGNAPILLRGEGGVGKNHLARAIHNDSRRADKPFMALNCKAIPRELFRSELLGSEEDGRPSKFELVDGGTLMLNQIESLPLEMQFALLDVVETKYVARSYGSRFIPVDVRIIAAASANLAQLVAEDDFVPNLYYRFGVFNISIPPLRKRTEDIPDLANRFLSRLTKPGDPVPAIDEEALEVLCRYPWPGNVRELESALEKALHHSDHHTIYVKDLSSTIQRGRVVTSTSPEAQPMLSVEEAERTAIVQAGWACHGQVTKMSHHLGISRTTLWRKMKQFNLSPDNFKQGH